MFEGPYDISMGRSEKSQCPDYRPNQKKFLSHVKLPCALLRDQHYDTVPATKPHHPDPVNHRFLDKSFYPRARWGRRLRISETPRS